MKFMIMKRLTIGLLWMLITLPAVAQIAPMQEEAAYAFSVVYLNYQDHGASDERVPGIDLKFKTGDDVFNLSVIEGSMSRDFSYRGLKDLVFLKEVKGPEGELLYQPLVSAQLGAPGRKLIVVLRKSTGALVAYPFDIDAKDFRPNTVRLINLSQQMIKAQVGEPVAIVDAMSVHDYKVEGDARKFLVSLIIVASDGENPYVIEKRRLAAAKNGRKVLLLFHDPRRLGKVTYASYTIGAVPPFENSSDRPVAESGP